MILSPVVRTMLALASVAIATVQAVESASPVSFFVSSSGSDTNPGSKSKPFATIERARDAVRSTSQERAKANTPVPITVYLRGGTYSVNKTILFGPEDSGTAQSPVTYSAYGTEKPVISGGKQITGWHKGESQLWQTLVPEVKDGSWYFHQLFVNGQRRTRARTPNKGFLYTEGILAPFDHSKWFNPDILAKRGFIYREGDITRWRNFSDAMIVIYHSWTTSIHLFTRLYSVDRSILLAPPSFWPIGYWWEYNTRYHVENIFEALDEPGEWYLNRRTGVLSYWPMPGENMRRVSVVAPRVPQTLIAFKGVPSEKRYVEHLRFKGISLQHTDCVIKPDMPSDQQGATERQPMIAANGLRHSVFENCELAHAGENALWLDDGCSDNIICHCHIHDIGGSAVFIGPKTYRDKPELLVERNTVDNCFIHDGSRIFLGSQGIWIGRSSYNQITHNEISDFHHLGISVGHTWGYAPSTAHHNLIAYNHVHHICNGFFSDGGGIYTLGISPGTVIRNNIVHDVVPTPQMPVGGTGIYHDEGSSGILVESNIVYRVGAGAYNQHYGRENIARNNIFAFGGSNTITCCRPEKHLSFTFENNIAISSAGQMTSDHYSPLKCNTEFRHNLYWDISGKPPTFSGISFDEWQKTGRDTDSMIADPQFYDAAKGDFRLKRTSPALAMGFKPIDTASTGLYGDSSWVDAPKRIKRAPLPVLPPLPPAPPPRPLVEDFESIPVGKQPDSFTCMPANHPELIQVSEEAAASGKRSLKFTKISGLKNSWEPHLYFSSSRFTSGPIHFECDIMNSASHPADCYIGLRDWGSHGGKYCEGPSIIIHPDGSLLASRKSLTRIPLDKWIHIDIRFNAASSKTYRLGISVAGDKERIFENIPMENPAFNQFTWFGFSSTGAIGSTFYVDNLRLQPSSKP